MDSKPITLPDSEIVVTESEVIQKETDGSESRIQRDEIHNIDYNSIYIDHNSVIGGFLMIFLGTALMFFGFQLNQLWYLIVTGIFTLSSVVFAVYLAYLFYYRSIGGFSETLRIESDTDSIHVEVTNTDYKGKVEEVFSELQS